MCLVLDMKSLSSLVDTSRGGFLPERGFKGRTSPDTRRLFREGFRR